METIAARVIGVDPGKATGVAVVDLVKNPKDFQDWKLLRNFAMSVQQMNTIDQSVFAKEWRLLTERWSTELAGPLVIVNEKYVVTRMSQQSQDTQSLDVTGMVKAVLDVMEIEHQYFEQLPSEAKLFMSDARLKELGMWYDEVTDHAIDALRHAATWCVKYVHSKAQLRPVADILRDSEMPPGMI